MNEPVATPDGGGATDATVERLRRENESLTDELNTARADVDVLQTRLAEIGSLRRHAIRTLVDQLHAGDSWVQRRLTARHPFRPSDVTLGPPVVGAAAEPADPLAAAAAADSRTVQSYRQPAPGSRVLVWYRQATRRGYGAAVAAYRRRRRNTG